jgi:hypothetical protein
MNRELERQGTRVDSVQIQSSRFGGGVFWIVGVVVPVDALLSNESRGEVLPNGTVRATSVSCLFSLARAEVAAYCRPGHVSSRGNGRREKHHEGYFALLTAVN